MKRKKAIMLSAFIEALVLGLLLVLYFTGLVSLNLFIALTVLVGLLSSAAVMIIIKKTEP